MDYKTEREIEIILENLWKKADLETRIHLRALQYLLLKINKE